MLFVKGVERERMLPEAPQAARFQGEVEGCTLAWCGDSQLVEAACLEGGERGREPVALECDESIAPVVEIQILGTLLELFQDRQRTAAGLDVEACRIGADKAGESDQTACQGAVCLDALRGSLQRARRIAGTPEPQAVDRTKTAGFAGCIDRVAMQPHLDLVAEPVPVAGLNTFRHEEPYWPAGDVGKRREVRLGSLPRPQIPSICRGRLEPADV